MELLRYYIIFLIYALVFFYLLRKKPTILSLQNLLFINLLYLFGLYLLRPDYDYARTGFLEITVIFVLIVPPLLFRRRFIIFNFSAPFFDSMVRENAKKILVDYAVENEHNYIVKTKEAEMKVSPYIVFYRTAILSYKGAQIGRKIEVYKNLLKKSFYNVLPTITINLKK